MQDPNINVIYIEPVKNTEKKGLLRVQHANDNVTFSFFGDFDKRRNSQLPDFFYNLSEFSSLELKFISEAQCKLTFTNSNPENVCSFDILEKKDIDKFLGYISQKVHVERSGENPFLFSLEPIERGISDFRLIVLPGFSNVRLPKKLDLKELNDLFKDSVENALDSNCSFSTLREALGQNDLLKDMDYASLKYQWTSILPEQFENYLNLETLIMNIEKDLKNKENLFSFKDNNKFLTIAFNVLMTYSIFNWDGGFYFEGEVNLLLPFLLAYVKEFGENCDENQCEKDIFETFALFYEKGEFGFLKTASKQPFIKPMLINVGNIINKNFHILLELLIQKNVNSLEFLIDDCSLWFLHLFNCDDILKLWLAILSTEKMDVFFESFIISLFITLSTQINEKNPVNYQEFVSIYNEIKKSTNINEMLHKTNQVYGILNNNSENK